MKIVINTDVLDKYDISPTEFLLLLLGYYDTDCQKLNDSVVEKGLAERNVMKGIPPVLSENHKKLISKILLESDEKIRGSGMNFERIARKMQDHYPYGFKPGTTYWWAGDLDTVIHNLKLLVSSFGFTFTEEEAVNAVISYLDSFPNREYTKHTRLLPNFILSKSKGDGDTPEFESLFMSYIENSRV